MYIKMNLKWGPIVVGINEEGAIFGLWFEGQKYFPDISVEEVILSFDIESVNNEDLQTIENLMIQETIATLCKQLKAYERGTLKEFSLKLSPSGTKFRNRVWKHLQEISYGETTTYGDIGKRVALEMNKASMSGQAIGGAVGHNPISIIIPCHRVVGSNGSLTGYAGGLDKKKSLLEHERIYM